MDERLHDLVDPDDVRLVAALERLATGLSRPPDEVTAARHRRAIRAAVVRSSGPAALGRGVAVAAGLAVLVAGLVTSPPVAVDPAVTDLPPAVDRPAEVPDAAWDRRSETTSLLPPAVVRPADGGTDEDVDADASRQDAEASRFGRETADEASDGRSEAGRATAEEAGPPQEPARSDEPPGVEAPAGTPGTDAAHERPVTQRDERDTVREADTEGSGRADDARSDPGTPPPSGRDR